MATALLLPEHSTTSYSHHLHERGGDALVAASALGGDGVLRLVELADLRGRGGAWFPTATKWRTTRSFRASELAPTLIVNGAEGEPGSFKDRGLLRADPYSVIEGAIIAADVVGADVVVLAIPESFGSHRQGLQAALDEVASLARPPLPAFEIVEGPDRYLFGEESALLEVIAGRPPFPRVGPPWRHGALDLDGRGEAASTSFAAAETDGPLPPPALVQNVETLARVAAIVRDPVAYEAMGQTFLATVTGDVGSARLVELPIGVSLRDVLGDDADGAAYVMNGVSHPLIHQDQFDLPLLPPGAGSRSLPIGTGAFQVFSADVDPRAVAAGAARFLSVESCGQCDPCKTDGVAIHEMLMGHRRDGDAVGIADELAVRAARVDEGARCGLAGQQRDVVEGLLAYFPDSLVDSPDPIATVPIVPMLDLVDGTAVIDTAHLTVQPDWTAADEWSGRYPAAVIDVAKGPPT